MNNNKKIFFLSIIIFVIALVTRFLFIDQIPTSFSHDQLNYLINSLSLTVTGLGKSGQWHPLSLTPVEPTLAEIPAVLIAPFMLLPFNVMTNPRILFALLSLTIPFFIALISWKLIKSKKASYFSWILALFNPWFWQNGRMTFDIALSVWIYTLGILVFLFAKKYRKLYALIPFIVGFYSYQGMKLILPPIAVALVLHYFFQKNKFAINKAKTIIAGILLTVIMSVFIFYISYQLPSQSGSQEKLQNQLLTPNSESVVDAVNTDRRLALSSPLNKVFINKYIQWSKEITYRAMLVFGWGELFHEISASSSSFAVWNHGVMYFIDSLLIVLGFYYLIKKKKYSALYLLSGFILISVIPSIVSESIWLFFRTSFMIPFLVIFAGIGLNFVYQRGKSWFILVSSVYFISILQFGFNYFIRYPVFSSENIFYSPRLLAEYLQRTPLNQKVVIFENEPGFLFTSYIFYNDLFNKETSSAIQKVYKEKSYKFGHIDIQECVPRNLVMQKNQLYIWDPQVGFCNDSETNDKESISVPDYLHKQATPVYIKSVKDNGTDYEIYNNSLCKDSQSLHTFIHPQTLREFNLHKLTNADFCSIWITRPLD